MTNNHKEIFLEKLQRFIESKEMIKLILSNRKNKSSDLKSIIITIVKLKSRLRLNFVYRHNTNDITKNYSFEDGERLIDEALNEKFYNAELLTSNENISLTGSKKNKTQLRFSEPTLQPLTSFNHDRVKQKPINTEENVYLRELGIINSEWKVKYEMSDKFKQINRYIELLAPYFKEINLIDDFHIADMGSGKGYLTFALYDYLTNSLRKRVKITGVEFRKNLVQQCNEISKKANFENLDFIEGTIEKVVLGQLDVLIALHACDTATDEAIFRGIKADASLIVCAPCCHKQIRKEFNVTNELSFVVNHGILKERQAEIITDSLRALLLEVNGYKTKVFEFISTEHTPKNIMIVGRKSKSRRVNRQLLLDNFYAIKKLYGIKKHYLETLLDM